MTFSRSFWELCSAKCTRLDGCLAEKPSSKTFSAFIFSWLASSVRSLCTLGRPPPPQLPHKTPRQLSSNSGYRVKFKPGLCPLSFLTFSGNCLFNLHPWKWFEGYPVKSTPFFSEWQKHLRFSSLATWEKAGFPKVNQKKMGAMPKKISGAFATLKTIG